MKKVLSVSSLIISVCVISATLYAQGVLKSNPSALEVVTARKFAMKIMGTNLQDIREKIKAGNIKEIGPNAGSIAALAVFMPLVYKEEYRDIYPVKGSKYFYKAEIADVAKSYEDLKVQAEKLMELAAAGDRSAVEGQFTRLLGSCASCHKPARGEY